MKSVLVVLVLVLAGAPALAQSNANLPPGGIVDGAKAGINDAEGTAPDGRPAPGGAQGEGRQAGTSGGKMVKGTETGASGKP